MVLHPDVYKKAQEEIDRVVGSDRAPEFDDLEQMPYMQALLKEVHRFRPNAPLIPRSATEDLYVRHFMKLHAGCRLCNLNTT